MNRLFLSHFQKSHDTGEAIVSLPSKTIQEHKIQLSPEVKNNFRVLNYLRRHDIDHDTQYWVLLCSVASSYCYAECRYA